jgi:D-sedoheptulose 7-phosphate isomerase
VVKAIEYVQQNSIHVISLTGPANTVAGELANCDIHAGANEFADRLQEIHIKVIHTLIE